jgi:hypothetical protein
VRASHTLVALIVCVCAQAASAQEPSESVVTDEVIVRGRTAEALRFEIERAENAMFERFNAINSHDDFDIRCTLEVRTGTHIPQRVCAPVFLRNAQATAGRDTVRSLQGSPVGGNSAQVQAGWASYRYSQLEDEMRRLVQQDEQLLAAMQRVLALRGIDESATEPTPDRRSSSKRRR